MHLSVDLSKLRIPMDVPTDETVIGLKSRIDQRIQVPPVRQQLIFNGTVLQEDARHLQRYGVGSGSVVHVKVNSTQIGISDPPSLPQQRLLRSMSISDIRLSHSMKDLPADLSRVLPHFRDRCLDRIEWTHGGLRRLYAAYEELCNPVELWVGAWGSSESKTVIPEKPDAPSCDPLPALFMD